MDYKNLLILLFSIIPAALYGQMGNYDLEVAPDIWFNKVDGIRIGGRMTGQMQGTFKDGPHRLIAGIWLGTKFPELPVSYCLSFTEPIPAISSFGNEGNVHIQSSIRTGYSWHRISLNKRFQKDFDELSYSEASISLAQEKMFDADYRHDFLKWTSNWKTLAGINFTTSGFSGVGRYLMNFDLLQNINQDSPRFTSGRLEVKHISELGKGFKLNIRVFTAVKSNNTPFEYRLSLSHREAVKWLNNGFSRARGTIPDVLFDENLVQISGGLNLRGYQGFYESHILKGISLNLEAVYPNPIENILNQSIFGDFAHLKTYIFYDVGAFSGNDINFSTSEVSGTVSDGGLGFQLSVNIPDYLGKDRGFALRYEIPLWLSDPVNPFSFEQGDVRIIEPQFRWRNLIGFGAVITF